MAAKTEADDLMDRIEHMDRRDAVNAILAQVGRRLTDEAYAAYGPGDGSRARKTEARPGATNPELPTARAQQPEAAVRREVVAPSRRACKHQTSPEAVQAAASSSVRGAGREREIAIIHPAWEGFLDFLVETAIKRLMEEQAERSRRGEPIEPAPAQPDAKKKRKPWPDEPELLTVEEAVARSGVSREEILAEFEKKMVPFEVTLPAPPSRRGRRMKNGPSAAGTLPSARKST